MRIKLILENDIGIKKRKLCYLVDEETCAKVSDVSSLIKKRFFTSGGKIALFMDGFLIPPQEELKIIHDNDVISVIFSPETESESENSSFDCEEDIKPVKKVVVDNNKKQNDLKELPHNTLANKAKILHKKSFIKESKSSNILVDVLLPKAASSIPKKIHIENVNNLTKAASVSTIASTNRKMVPKKVISKPLIKKTITLSKLGTNNGKEMDSTDSTDSSSSSSEEETPTIKKKTPVMQAVKQPVTNQMVSKQPCTKKTNEGTYTKIKAALPALINKSKGTANGKTVKHFANSKATKQLSSSNDSSDSSSDSSDNSSGDKKNIVNVDFNVSNPLKTKNICNTSNVGCTDNSFNNINKPIGNSKAKAKKMDPKDEIMISKPITMVLSSKDNAKNLIGGSLDIKDVIGENSNSNDVIVKSSNNTVFDHSNTFNSSNNYVSGKTLRNRRRHHVRKENMRIRHHSAKKDKLSGNANGTSMENEESTQDNLKANNVTFDVVTNVNGDATLNKVSETVDCNIVDNSVLPANNGTIVIEDDTTETISQVVESKSSEPPDVGSVIGYTIMEMSTIHHTPQISQIFEF